MSRPQVLRTTAPATTHPGAAGARSSDGRPFFAYAAVLVAVAGFVAELVPHGTLRLVLLLALIMFGPGSAMVSFAPIGDRVIAAALAVGGSLSATCFAAVLTFWTHVWNPEATLSVLAGATLVTGIAQAARLPRPAIALRPQLDKTLILPVAALAVAVALWAVALHRLKPSGVGPYGFTAALGVLFVIGVVVLGLGFAVELHGARRPWVLTLLILAVPLFMQATVPLLDGTIEYAWTYKHIGVVDLVRDYGHIIDSSDIYQQWPGFFAVVALISKVSHVDGLSFAAWASLTFGLINMLMTTAVLRQFTTDRRIVAIGVFIAQAAMWVDIGYFSPQAFAYALMLVFYAVVLRWLIDTPRPPAPAGRFLKIKKLYGWLVRDMPPARPVTPRTRFWAGLAATGLYGAITVSHQLTPVVMMVPIVVFAILRILKPWWFVLVLTAVALAFIGPRIESVSSQYSIFSFDLLANASGNAAGWNTPEQEFSAYVSRVLAIGLWAIALWGLWLARKRLGTVLVAGLLAYLPITTLAGGSYGGEAIYRVAAFSLPFTGLLCAEVWVAFTGWWARRTTTATPPLTEAKPSARPPASERSPLIVIGGGVLAALIFLAGLQGLQGQLIVHQMTRTDIKASEYFYEHAEPGSALILIAPNFPSKLRGNYGSFNKGHVSVDISLVGDPTFANNLGADKLATIQSYIERMKYPVNYLVLSYAMQRYTNYFGDEPTDWLTSLQAAIDQSSDWTTFYRAGGVAIYKLKTS